MHPAIVSCIRRFRIHRHLFAHGDRVGNKMESMNWLTAHKIHLAFQGDI